MMWKPIKGYEDFYLINERGEILSLRSNKLRIPGLGKNGYYNIFLCNDTGKKCFNVHRLVAETFIPNPLNLPVVNHKDEDKTNNHVDNLEWCSYSYNNTYNDLKARGQNKRIRQISKEGAVIKIWACIHDAHRAGIANYKNISAVCRGLRLTAGGYKWEYDKEV